MKIEKIGAFVILYEDNIKPSKILVAEEICHISPMTSGGGDIGYKIKDKSDNEFDVMVGCLDANNTELRTPANLLTYILSLRPLSSSIIGSTQVVSSTNSNPSSSPNPSELLFVRQDTGAFWFNVAGAWVGGNTLITPAERLYWNSKQDSLGYTPENASNKGQPEGYTPLDSTAKVPATNSRPSSATYDNITGVLTFTWADGSTQNIDLPIENLVQNASYNSSTQVLTLTTNGGGTVNINLSSLVDLPEIVLSASSDPATAPTTGQKLYIRQDNGAYWTNVGGSWVGGYLGVTSAEKTTWNNKQNALGFTPEDSANKSTSTADSASNIKFPVWSALVSYYDATRVRSILGITTLSGSNTGDETTSTIQTKRPLKTINGNSLEGSGNIVITGGSGDVTGDTASTDTAIALFNGTTGKAIKNSVIKVTATGGIVLPEDSAPTAPASGELKLFNGNVSGRRMPAFVGQTNLDTLLQPFMGKTKVGLWSPSGNSATVPAVIGMPAFTTTGFTATARAVATTNMFTRTRRIGLVTAATAGTVGRFTTGVNQYSLGDGAGLGGFHLIMRFGISDASAVATARMFMGVRVFATPTNVEPSTLTNCIGLGHGSDSTNMFLYYGGSTAQTPIDLGVNFPANTLSTDLYELALFSSPNVANSITWTVTRLNTGVSTSGTITGNATVVPQSSSLMAIWGYRTNNATALAVGVDVVSVYTETDQ